MNRLRRISFHKKKDSDLNNETIKSETQAMNKPIKKKIGLSFKKKIFSSKSTQRSLSLDESKVKENENKSKAKASKARNSTYGCIELNSNSSEINDYNEVFEQSKDHHDNNDLLSNNDNDHHDNSTGDYFQVSNKDESCNNNNRVAGSSDVNSNHSNCDVINNNSNNDVITSHETDDVTERIVEGDITGQNIEQLTDLNLQRNNNNDDVTETNNNEVATSFYLGNVTSHNSGQFVTPVRSLLPSSGQINRSTYAHVHNLSNEFKRLAQQGWYWGPLTRSEAEDKLNLTPDGAFLVRDSSDERYLLSLSFRSNERTLHTRIEHSAGNFSFYENNNTPSYSSVVDLILDSIRDSQVTGVFCYSRPRDPLDRTYPVRLTHPVSRLSQVRSLQYLCRFLIRQYTRIDHIENLPLPNLVKGYLNQSPF